jgi:rod shape determining protein RodA
MTGLESQQVTLGTSGLALDRVFQRGSRLRRLDWLLIAATLALCGIGTALVWSATKTRQASIGGDPTLYLQRHLLNVGIGVVLGAAMVFLDYRVLRAYTPIIYVASLVGIVATFFVGSTINGAHAWIVLGGGFQLQPSEFAKVALVLGMAMILAERRDAENEPRSMDVMIVLALAAVPMLLVLLGQDLGTATVLAFTVLGVLALSGAKMRWVIGLLLAAVLVGFVGFKAGMVKQHQIDRIKAFTDPRVDARGIGYNSKQARIAIGSGGLFGRGLGHGPQTQGGFVPEQQTDFIFTVAGEELGLAGAGVIIVLLGFILWRGFRIAARAPDMFGRLVAVGVICWFAYQSFINIGMTLGITPVTGLPLPFVSYGGSAMFANLMAIGLLQNVQLRSTER